MSEIVSNLRQCPLCKEGAIFDDNVYCDNKIVYCDSCDEFMFENSVDKLDQLQQENAELKAESQKWYKEFDRLRNKTIYKDAGDLLRVQQQRDALAELCKDLLEDLLVFEGGYRLYKEEKLKQILKGGEG